MLNGVVLVLYGDLLDLLIVQHAIIVLTDSIITISLIHTFFPFFFNSKSRPWVGNCIGKRNYRYFLMFLYLTWTVCFYMFGLSVAIVTVISNESSKSGFDAFIEAISTSPMAIIMCLYSFLVFWSLSGLGGYHLYLVSNGISTNEDIKGNFKEDSDRGHRPYDFGCLVNYRRMFCPPYYPAYLTPLKIVSIADSASSTNDLSLDIKPKDNLLGANAV
jgi:hypothetical protein